MKENNVVTLENPAEITHDLLTNVIRQGAQQLLAAAVEAEVAEFLSKHHKEMVEGNKQRFVRNGHLPERQIQTGVGDVTVKVPRVRDRAFKKGGISYGSSIIPKYLRRTGDLNELIPLLYLKGLSTNDFVSALTPLVGKEAKNLSPGVISRLKAKWEQEYSTWRKRDLSGKKYVYWWADGIYLTARMEDAAQCVLVVMGVTAHGDKELIAIETGFRESKDSWLDLMRNLKKYGISQGPSVAVGDGALGFWGALTEMFPSTRHQRCWFHKMDSVTYRDEMGLIMDSLPH